MNDQLDSEKLPSGLALMVQHYLDGEIGAEEFRQLQSLLEESDAARSYFRSYSNMDSNLRELAGEEADDGMDEFLPRPQFSGGRGIGASVLQAVATFVLGAAAVYFFVVRAGGKEGEEKGDDARSGSTPGAATEQRRPAGLVANGVAILTQAVGVEWAEDTDPISVGAVLPQKVIALKKGLLQIEFFSGATVVVEGPARFEPVDKMRAVCHSGKCRTIVPEYAEGFSISSEKLELVDLGTESALEVDEDGVAELHVYVGDAEVHEKPGGKVHNLMAGGGVRIGAAAEAEFVPLNEMGFVDAQRMAFLASAEADKHLRRWLLYSEELKANPDVLLYYSFDERATWSRKLRNVRKMTADPLHGAIVGCRWSEGRWVGKGSLEFKREGDRVRIQIPGEHDAFTLMAWVRIDGFDREFNSLMLSDNWVPGGAHWQFTRDGELVLGTKLADVAGHYQSGPVLNQSHLGRWIQLAVSYDNKRREVKHYVNGRQVWRGKIDHPIPVSVPRGELGNWRTDYQQPPGQGLRNLNGRMDEFVVFSRGLGNAELLKVYNEGKPHS